MNKQSGFIGAILVGLFGLLVIGLIIVGIWQSVYFSTNHHQVSFTVNKAERVEDRNGNGSQYQVYTDGATYKIVDSTFNGRFNSSDLYGQLIPGHKYTCDAVGIRNPYWSEYENLISCTEIRDTTNTTPLTK